MKPNEDRYLFHLSDWTSKFPLDAARSRAWLTPGGSPVETAYAEQFRRRIIERVGLDNGVPTEVFVWAKGEPSNRACTKIGGIPYWPEDRPWPTSNRGETMRFLAQYDFSNSRKLFDQLPGDILCIFVTESFLDMADWKNGLQTHWVSRSAQRVALLQSVPPEGNSFVFTNVYGYSHFTLDYGYENVDDIANELLAFSDEFESYPLDEAATSLLNTWTVKIGGVPLMRYTDPRQQRTVLPGRFLCQLCTVYPPDEMPYPWINHEQPLTLMESIRPETRLDISDGFTLCFSLTDDGVVHRYYEGE